MSDSCWVCGSTDDLAVRPLVAWTAERAATIPIATCFPCRAKLHEAKDREALATFGADPRAIRFRTLDMVAAFAVVAASLFLGSWAGWIGAGGYTGAAIALALAPIAAWLYMRIARQHEAERQTRWDRSREKGARDELAAVLDERWADVCRHLAADGLITQTTVGNERRVSVEAERLIDPETWRHRNDATYVAFMESGTAERTLDPARP